MPAARRASVDQGAQQSRARQQFRVSATMLWEYLAHDEARRRGPDDAAQMTRLGVVFLPQLPPEELRQVAVAADEAGLEELWLWEDCFFESGIASMAAALAWTRRLRVGVGLVPVPLRNVALTAMEVATLHRLFPGRVRVGVGHGVQSWMRQVGAGARSPLTLLREYTAALRPLLEGEEVTTDGAYVRLDRVQLAWPPAGPVQLLVGATGPLSLRLAGEMADGTILTGGTSVEGLRRARAHVEQGRVAAKSDRPHHFVVYVMGATGPGAAERLEREYERWGLGPDDRAGVVGDAEQMARAIGEWAQAGAGTVVVQPTRDEPDIGGFIDFLGREVRPLLGTTAPPGP